MIRVVRLGTPRVRGEGLRIGTVRRPPRGVRKSDVAARDFYDVWFPELAPSADLVKRALEAQRSRSSSDWRRVARDYRKEMAAGPSAHSLDLLAALSHRSNFSVGCYCEDPAWCHRSILAELLGERGAAMSRRP